MKDASNTMKNLIDALTASLGFAPAPFNREQATDQIISVRGDQRTLMIPADRKDPRSKKAKIVFRDAKDFIAYINEHKMADHTRTFLDTTKPQERVLATCVLDYHGAGAGLPNWGDHIATLECPVDDELKAWIDLVGQPQSQEAFALFIEDHAHTLARPSPAELIKVALQLQGTLTGSYTAQIDLDRSNATLHYEEKDSGVETLEIPRQLDLYTPMFCGGSDETFKVNLAMKVLNGRPTFTVRMPGLKPALKTAARHLRDLIADGIELPVYDAQAPAGMETRREIAMVQQATYAPAAQVTTIR